jgi:hypothetical protein
VLKGVRDNLKISMYSIISFLIVYIVLGYTLFAIKYTSPVDIPLQDVAIDKFINSITHLWHIRLVIALLVAAVVNLIVCRKIMYN